MNMVRDYEYLLIDGLLPHKVGFDNEKVEK